MTQIKCNILITMCINIKSVNSSAAVQRNWRDWHMIVTLIECLIYASNIPSFHVLIQLALTMLQGLLKLGYLPTLFTNLEVLQIGITSNDDLLPILISFLKRKPNLRTLFLRKCVFHTNASGVVFIHIVMIFSHNYRFCFSPLSFDCFLDGSADIYLLATVGR